ncbi:flagellin [Microvirga arabica]|uniref:Flagellin n=1 Tax=Microvirga arabica TaxID=1128671 RepID=A0ABV6YGG8_9HYPH
MSSINTNLSAITALQSLKATQTSMNKNQNQISTGLRVSEASHNASYWSISTKMKSDNGALGAVKDSIKQSKAMIDTYTSALDKSMKYLDTMKAKLTAGSNPGADLAAIQVELKSSIEGLKSAAGSATFNGQNWLEGSPSTVKLVTSYDGESQKVNSLEIDTTKVNLFDDVADPKAGLLKNVANIDIATAPKAQGYTDLAIDAAKVNATAGSEDKIYIKLSDAPNTTLTFTVTGTGSLQDLADDINADAGADNVDSKIEASVVDGKLRITSKTAGVDVSASFSDTAAGAAGTAAGTMKLDTTALTGLSQGDKIKFTANAVPLSFTVGSEKNAAELAASINADTNLKTQVTATSDDDGNLILTSKTGTVSAMTFENTTKGVDTTYGQIAVKDALKAVDKAINDLRAGSAMLGANKALLETQEEFIGVLSDSLTAGVSAFIDADMNEVSTRNQALQTQQQLGVQALSMANQNSQMILKLFQ